MVAEKILTEEEAMPPDWPLQGSTGYDFLAAASQLLTDADGSRELLAFYREHVIRHPAYETIVFERKLDFLLRYMGGELDNLMDLLISLPNLRAATQDKGRLKEALAIWMAAFPAYRAYPDADGGSPGDNRLYITALGRARDRQPDLLPEFNFLAGLYDYNANHVTDHGDVNRKSAGICCGQQRLAFLSRLMQFTGPLAAKGIEDTSFYVYNPYIAHCEVGDTPRIAGIDTQAFHRRMQQRLATQRYSLNATTTHDTKRGEDSRIRLSVLGILPQEWISAVGRWRELHRSHIAVVKGRPAPSPNDEYLIYQALLGGFPEDGIVTDEFRERFSGYLTKALREAKAETNYDAPDEGYEKQCQDFAAALLAPDSLFLEDFVPFVFAIIRLSAVYSLSQLLLKTTAPGIPDIYQGAELWETSFVDPDNRRPVDFRLRATLLQEIKKAAAEGKEALLSFLHSHQQQGAGKLFTLHRVLECRNRLPALFAEGNYIPLQTHGPLLAYLRHHRRDWVLIAVPLIRFESSFPATVSLDLPPEAPDHWTNVFTGDAVATEGFCLQWPEGLTEWPVILLTAHRDDPDKA